MSDTERKEIPVFEDTEQVQEFASTFGILTRFEFKWKLEGAPPGDLGKFITKIGDENYISMSLLHDTNPVNGLTRITLSFKDTSVAYTLRPQLSKYPDLVVVNPTNGERSTEDFFW